jgi:hypothetical protein
VLTVLLKNGRNPERAGDRKGTANEFRIPGIYAPRALLFTDNYGSFGEPPWRIPMKRLLILFLPIFFLSTQQSAQAQGVSFGIPLPFPFLFYNFNQGYYAQPAYYGGYYRQPSCAPAYHRRAYYSGYYRPYYRPAYYQPGWYGYGWPRYYGPGPYGYGP